MTGAHRQTDLDPVRAGLKSVQWLLQLVGIIAILLGIVGIGAYLIATDSKFLPIAIMAVQGFAAIVFARKLAMKVLRNRAPSPVVLADWIGELANVIAWVALLLANMSVHLGWVHGAIGLTLVGICALFVAAMPVYSWRGKQRVVLALTGRAVAGRWPWSATD